MWYKIDAPTYLLVRLFFVIAVLASIVVFVVIFVLEVTFFKVIIDLLELQRLSSEPIDRARNEFFLDVLAELIIKFQALFNIRSGVIFVCFWSFWRIEEVD